MGAHCHGEIFFLPGRARSGDILRKGEKNMAEVIINSGGRPVVVREGAPPPSGDGRAGPPPPTGGYRWPPPALPRRPSWLSSINLFWLIVAVVWELGTLSYLAFMYLLFTCQGLIELFPEMFGQRLSKWFRSLAHYEPWHRFTIGHLAATGMALAVLVSWFWLLKEWTFVGGNQLDPSKRNVRNTRLLFSVGASLVLLADCILFFHGLRRANNWDGSDNTFASVVLTALYLGMLLVFSLFSVSFWSNVRRSQS